jgi:hypothetical protein
MLQTTQLKYVFNYQSTPKKLITKAKMSSTPFEIHKSKLIVIE